ncbi:MAG TPA: hypothetical protein VGH96_12150 [Streptosporangiaceae bacterium]|jgi:hypothetical protein
MTGQNVSFDSVSFNSDGCTLAGTYAEVAQPVAAALLIPGSGRTDRIPVSPEVLGIITAWVARTWGEA